VVTGSDNSFFGRNSGALTTSPNFNSFYGAFSGQVHTIGESNTFIGYASGGSTTSGAQNTFLGRTSGFGNTTGAGNVYVGYVSGRLNQTGSFNVFIGHSAGFNELGSNKLYIDNSNTSTPLIYGDFSANQVGINALPAGYTLNVGGPINATGVFVNGVAVGGGGGSSQWSNNTGATPTTIYYNGGNVGIGNFITATTGTFKLAVDGKIGAREVQVTLADPWPDYVFESSYKLMTLKEVGDFIKANRHLPGIPSAKDVADKGHNLGEMNALLLKKVEELTLYLIEMKEEIETLKSENSRLSEIVKK